LNISTTPLPSAVSGGNFKSRITVTGGSQPYKWQMAEGMLPPGLKLNPTNGSIAGVPTTPGMYNFSVSVTDSAIPALSAVRSFSITVTAALAIDWKTPPAVHGQMLEGSALVKNLTAQDFVLTVIVMGVNQIGRATALGYQKFTLKSGADQLIPFGSSPGPGTYIVHADAVAEVAKTGSIFRARKQTANPLVIQTPQ
jgi:hypothetical protein